MNKKRIIAIAAVVLVLVFAVSWCVYDITAGSKASHIDKDEAAKLINEQFDKMAVTKPLKFIAAENHIKVQSLSYGQNKDINLKCTIDTIDTYEAVLLII